MPLISPFVLQFAFLKYLDLIGIVVFVGLPAFKILVFSPALRAISNPETREVLETCEAKFSRKIVPLVILYLILLQGVILVHQIETLTGRPIGQAIPILNHWLTGTFSGLLWINKFFVLIFIGLLSRFETPRKDVLLFASGILLCLSASLSGHALSGKIYALVMTDWLHFSAVAIWVGALLPLRHMLRRLSQCLKPEQQVLFLRKLVENFSLWAILAVSIIVLTGVFNVMVYVGPAVFYFETQYTKVFFLKLCFVLVVFGFGGLARFYILPRLKKKETSEGIPFIRLQRLFLRMLTFELLFVTGVLILAALLTQTEI